MAKPGKKVEKTVTNTQSAPAATGDDGQIKINWDTAGLSTAYANVCNVSSTREEVTMLFGTNQSFSAKENQLTVELTDRIILNPYAAKRLAVVLSNVMQGYEDRFGALPLEEPKA